MTQHYCCHTFDYCALSTRLCNVYIDYGTKIMESDRLCTLTQLCESMHYLQKIIMWLHQILTINRKIICLTITLLKRNIKNKILTKLCTRIFSW